MENSYTMWLEHLSSIRNQHNSINFYTTNQLIYIRNLMTKYLMKHSRLFSQEVEQLNQPSESFTQLFDMMYVLTQTEEYKITANVLLELFNKSKDKFKSTQRGSKESRRSSVSSKNQNNETFIQKFASDNNYNEAVVRKAVERFGVLADEDLHNYCLENDSLDFNDDSNLGVEESSKQLMEVSINGYDEDILMNEGDIDQMNVPGN